MTPEQRGVWTDLAANCRIYDGDGSAAIVEAVLVRAVDDELADLRAALASRDRYADSLSRQLLDREKELATSQAREATLREALLKAGSAITFRRVTDVTTTALADPSPVADALGRVARASVRAVQAEWEPDRTTLDQARIQQRAAVEGLLAVAPHWAEPQGGG